MIGSHSREADRSVRDAAAGADAAVAPLLFAVEIAPEASGAVRDAGIAWIDARSKEARAELSEEARRGIRAVITNGSIGFDAEDMAWLPSLEIVCALGAGYENVDLEAAHSRGVIVTNGPGTNAETVADHAAALLLALARDVVGADAAVRRGAWSTSRHTRPTIHDKRLGVLGLGTVGTFVAERMANGFGMTIAYHSRKPRTGTRWQHLSSPVELAAWSDFLVVCLPGGAATHRAVDAGVLRALGPAGYLVNVARGSVLDTVALIEALERGTIAGAALDVIEGEPAVPPRLLTQARLVLTPHIAGRSPEAVLNMVRFALDNIVAHLEGREVRARVGQTEPSG